MELQVVKCELCGYESHQLLAHVREEHDMDPETYLGKYKKQMISHAFARFMKLRWFRWDAAVDEVAEVVNFMGIELPVSLFSGAFVPRHDPDFVFPEIASQVALSLRESEKIMLIGPTGGGKSTLIEQIAHRLRWPLIRVSMSSGLTEADLLGEMVVKDRRTVFSYGFLPQAMRMGAICLIDEIDGMEPSVGFAIHQVLEDQGRLVILQNGAEIIQPHPRFRIVATGNTTGLSDEAGMYTGTRVLNAAFLDRFISVFRVDYPSEEREARIIRSRVPDCPGLMTTKFIKVATDIRQATANKQLYCTFSTRRLIALARKYVQTGRLNVAIRLAFLNKIEGPEQQVAAEICQRHLGDIMAKEEEEDAMVAEEAGT